MDDVKKLTHAEFMDAFYKGKGRALMHVRRFGDEGLRDILLQGCLHEVGYDKQMEDRGGWMIEMIQATSEPDYYFNAVLADYLDNTTWHDVPQQSDIVDWLAANGNESAKALLYKKYELQQLDGWKMQCIGRRLVKLDGINALLYAAEISGKRLQTDNTHSEWNWLIDYACETYGEEAILPALHKAAADNANIKTYMDKVLEAAGAFREDKNKVYTDKRPIVTLQELLEEMETLTVDSKRNALRGKCSKFAVDASEAELLSLFDHMLKEKRTPQLLRYLWCFRKREMPRIEPSILQLTQSQDKNIRYATISALGLLTHDEVRALATSMLEAGSLEGLELFQHNFRAGDFDYIAPRLITPPDNDIAHSACSDLLGVCEANKAPEALGCLLWIYENTPCSACRGYAINGLTALNILPELLAKECRYDCNEETRHEVAKYLKLTLLH